MTELMDYLDALRRRQGRREEDDYLPPDERGACEMHVGDTIDERFSAAEAQELEDGGRDPLDV